MTITALQEAQHYADDLMTQLELLASTAEIYSHAPTPEAVNLRPVLDTHHLAERHSPHPQHEH